MEEFLRAIEEEFDGREAGTLQPDQRFRELEDWSSMQALLVIARIDADYGVTLTAEEVRGAQTFADLYAVLQKRLSV